MRFTLKTAEVSSETIDAEANFEEVYRNTSYPTEWLSRPCGVAVFSSITSC